MKNKIICALLLSVFSISVSAGITTKKKPPVAVNAEVLTVMDVSVDNNVKI